MSFFNAILTSSHVPDSWAIGKIVPIYHHSKQLVNNRLLSVIDIHYNQAAFRKDHRVKDHIILLKNLADLYNNKNNKLYCVSIDYSLILYGAKDCGISY